VPFRPGISGNPSGRPPKKRALTETLEKWGHKTVVYNGKPVAGRLLLSRLIWQGITTGTITFPDGSILHLGPTDWKDLLKFLYSQIDGPPPADLHLSGADGGTIQVDLLPPSEIAARVAALMASGEVTISEEDR